MVTISKKEALAAFDGSASKLAKALKVSPQFVYQWKKNAPINQALKLVKLRPDLWRDRMPKL